MPPLAPGPGRWPWRFACTGLLILTVPFAAAGQTCAGGLSFNYAPLQLGAAAAAAPAQFDADVAAGYGSDRLFASGFAGLRAARGDDDMTARVGLTVGVDQPARLDTRLHLCPAVTASRTQSRRAPDTDLTAHVRAGWLARNSAGLAVVPSIGLGFGTNRSGGVEAAVGFVVRARYAVTPRIAVPWRRTRDEAGVAIAFVMDVGGE